MKHDEQPLFFNDWFHCGKRHEREIGPDFPDHYSVQSYLSYLTAGQEVAVGQLELARPVVGGSGENGMLIHEMTAVILEKYGVFLCEPVFDTVVSARQTLEASLRALDEALGGTLDQLPVYPLLVSVRPEMGISGECLDVTFFADPINELISRANAPGPASVEFAVKQLLKRSYFVDCKSPGHMDHWPIPWWLAKLQEATETRVAAA